MPTILLWTIQCALSDFVFDWHTCCHVAEYCEERRRAKLPAIFWTLCGKRAKRVLKSVTFVSADSPGRCYESFSVTYSRRRFPHFFMFHVRVLNNQTNASAMCTIANGEIMNTRTGLVRGGWTHRASLLGPETDNRRAAHAAFVFDRLARLFAGDGVGVLDLLDSSKEGDPWIRPPLDDLLKITGLLEPLCSLVIEFAKVSVLVIDTVAWRTDQSVIE